MAGARLEKVARRTITNPRLFIEGFAGARSADDGIPVLVKYIAEVGLEGSDSLRQFAAWCKSLEWLPQEDVHFDRGHGTSAPLDIPSLCLPARAQGFTLANSLIASRLQKLQ
jgi:hypothetical protein